MAINLVKAGHAVTGFDTLETALGRARQAGIATPATIGAMVAKANCIVTMLPKGAIVLSVLQQVIAAAKPGTMLIDCSTIDFSDARKLHSLAVGAGLHCLDAPVSGGVGGAEAGTLTFMAGGSAATFGKARPILEKMGKRLVHCGDGGAGQAAKICNNMLLGISMIGACEAFALAERLGLSQKALFDVVSASSGSCWSVNAYCPVPNVGPKSPADNDYKPGFAAALMLKDLSLSQQAADACGMATPMGLHATELYSAFVDTGHANTDFSGMINYLKTLGRQANG